MHSPAQTSANAASPDNKQRALAHYSRLATEAAVDAHLAGLPPVRHLHLAPAAAQVIAHKPPAPIPAPLPAPEFRGGKPTIQTEADRVVAAVNARNARTSERIEAGLGCLLALVVGVIGGLLLVKWATACDTGHLCAVALVTPTRLSPWRRLAELRAELAQLGLGGFLAFAVMYVVCLLVLALWHVFGSKP